MAKHLNFSTTPLANPNFQISGLAIVTGLLFFSIFKEYAYLDDYYLLCFNQEENFSDVFIQGGRLISGLLMEFLITKMDLVAHIKWLRIISVVGIFIFSTQLLRVLKKYGIEPVTSFFITLVFLCSPFISIIGNWGATFQVPWACAIALIGGELVLDSLLQQQKTRRLDWKKLLAGGSLGIVSLFSYQTAYTTFLIPGLIYFLIQKELPITGYFLGIHLVIYMVYYPLFKLTLVMSDLPPLDRAGIEWNVFNQVFWFFGKPFIRTLRLSFLFHDSIIVGTVRAITGLLILTYLWKWLKSIPKKWVILYLILVLGFYFLSYLPQTISTDHYVARRSIGTLSFIHIFLALGGLSFWLSKSPKLIALTGITFLFLTQGFYNNTFGFSFIQSREYTSLKQAVESRLGQKKIKELRVIRPRVDFLKKEKLLKKVVGDEFGRLSNAEPWVPLPFFTLIIRELNPDPGMDQEIGIKNIEKPEASQYDPDTVIDVEKIYKEVK